VNKDEILQALRLTAMGRVGHPEQERFAEKLAELFATPEQRAETEMAAAGIAAPKRRKKAD
jgi:hypothetical protein